jgi:hypothetical protein
MFSGFVIAFTLDSADESRGDAVNDVTSPGALLLADAVAQAAVERAAEDAVLQGAVEPR